MEKDFDGWNKEKKKLNKNKWQPYAHCREIWWCVIGINVGAEIDGKNNNFERPVIVIKVYNKETLLVLPLTSKGKVNRFHFKISTGNSVKLTQTRVISSKRLLRKITILPEPEFNILLSAWKKML